MILRQSQEGVVYVLGTHSGGQPGSFSEISITKDELGLAGDGSEVGRFGTLAIAEQAATEVKERFGVPAEVYRIEITRVLGTRLRPNERK